MKSEKLLYAVGQIDDGLVLDALEAPDKIGRFADIRSRRVLLGLGSLAACLCILLIAVLALRPSRSAPEGSRIIVTEAGVYIPQMEVQLPRDSSACMIGFFIYQNRSYVEYTTIEAAPGLRGDCLGTASDTLDAWSTAEDYVELSGSVAGDFYSVTGYDPAFLLCMEEGSQLRLYVNDNNITLQTGSDLFEDRLHLTDRFRQVQYQTREDWYYGLGNIKSLDDDSYQTVAAFVRALCEAPFMRMEDIPLPEGAVSAYDDLEIYHMYFHMEDGLTIHLRLFEGGYVQFAGIRGVCVRVPEEAFQEMTAEFAGKQD